MKRLGPLLAMAFLANSCLHAQTWATSARIPALGIYVPDAYGKGYLGNLSLGITLQSRSRLSGDLFNPDGNGSLNVGLGNPESLVGLDLRINIYGFFNSIGSPGNLGEGSLDIFLSRRITPDWWVCAGINDFTGWDLAPAHRIHSAFTTTTGIIHLRGKANTASAPFSRLYLTAGMGNGRFRSDEDYSIDYVSPLGFIAAAALQIGRETNLFAEWNGYTAIAGLAAYPFRRLPLQIILGVDDVFHEKWKFIAAVGAGINLRKSDGNNPLRRLIFSSPPPPQTSRVNP